MHGEVTLGTVDVVTRRLPTHHTDIALNQPVRHLALGRKHLRRCHREGFTALRLFAALTRRELGHMVFDRDLSWRTFIKLNGEGGVALDHRRRGRRGAIGVFGWYIIQFHHRGLGVSLELLGGNLEVTGLSVVQKNFPLAVAKVLETAVHLAVHGRDVFMDL